MPDIVRKAAVLLLNFQECPCIGNGSLYFQAVSYDAGITPQCFQLVLSVSADFLRIKIVKSHAKGISLVQNTFPGQARLKALQYQHFKELQMPDAVAGLSEDFVYPGIHNLEEGWYPIPGSDRNADHR